MWKRVENKFCDEILNDEFHGFKVMAGEHLLGKRLDWGLKEKWEGNYLSNMQENPSSNVFNDAVNKNLKNDGIRKVNSFLIKLIFSSNFSYIW